MMTILIKVNGNEYPKGLSWGLFLAPVNEKFCVLPTNRQPPTALVPVSQAAFGPVSASTSSGLCPEGEHSSETRCWQFLRQLLHTSRPCPHWLPRYPSSKEGDCSKGQNKPHLASHSTYYLDFSALYSRIPSAGPQICTRSSLVSFNKSAPGKTQEDFMKILLEHLYI